MMKKVLIAIAGGAVLAAMSMAQAGQNAMPSNAGRRNLDASKTVRVEGKIVDIKSCDLGNGPNRQGLVLTVSNAQGASSVIHLGPGSYIKSQGWEFKTGDPIAVTAYNGVGKLNGHFIAASLTAPGKTLQLRDDSGRPSWKLSGQRRHAMKGNRPGRGNNRFNKAAGGMRGGCPRLAR